MKRILLPLVAAAISTAAIQHSANAQGNNNVSNFTDSKIFIKSIQTVATLDFPVNYTNIAAADASAVNVKAIKDFKNRFDKASEEKWFAIPSGYMSYFKLDGFGDRAFYDKKGHWQTTMKFYDETRLPVEVRRLVRSTYLDFNITIVEEVDIPDAIVYLVHIEDKSSIKILRVTPDLDMDVLQEFQKG
jgi:hypothetical protein